MAAADKLRKTLSDEKELAKRAKAMREKAEMAITGISKRQH
jgi:hypothetical protein